MRWQPIAELPDTFEEYEMVVFQQEPDDAWLNALCWHGDVFNNIEYISYDLDEVRRFHKFLRVALPDGS